MIDAKYIDNRIPERLKKKLDKMVMVETSIIILSLFIIGWLMGFRLLAIFLPIFLGGLAVCAHLIGYRYHPTQIAFTEDEIILKRPNGKIKHLSWKKITGLRVGKNAAIFVNSFFEPVIYIFGETEENALYYFKKYGVKKNPKLEKVIFNLEMKKIYESGRD